MEITPEIQAKIEQQAKYVAEKFKSEMTRLYKSGAITPENDSLGLITKVAIDNTSDGWGILDKKEYNNLRKF